MEAVGIYLNRLVDLNGLKVGAVCEAAGVKPGYISRLISEEIKEPSAKVLYALNRVVGGNWDHVGELLRDQATPDQANVLAEAWYNRLKKMSGSERDAMRRRLIEAIRPFMDDPDRIDDLLSP